MRSSYTHYFCNIFPFLEHCAGWCGLCAVLHKCVSFVVQTKSLPIHIYPKLFSSTWTGFRCWVRHFQKYFIGHSMNAGWKEPQKYVLILLVCRQGIDSSFKINGTTGVSSLNSKKNILLHFLTIRGSVLEKISKSWFFEASLNCTFFGF